LSILCIGGTAKGGAQDVHSSPGSRPLGFGGEFVGGFAGAAVGVGSATNRSGSCSATDETGVERRVIVRSDPIVLALFRKHGAVDDVVERVETDTSDEAIFVVSSEDLLRTHVRDLTDELQAVLGRKVWVTTDPGMFGRTVRLSAPGAD